MHRHSTLASLLAILLSVSALAEPKRLGTLVSTGTSVNQSTTATPFSFYSVGLGDAAIYQLDIQCDAAACLYWGTGSSTSVSCTAGNASKGVRVESGQLLPVCLTATNSYVAAISVTGTANCEVYWEPIATSCH